MARKSRKNPPLEVAPAIERKTAIYVRLSREVVEKKGDSLENQKKICQQHLLTLPELGTAVIYEDNGFSGQNTNRPEFQRLLVAVEKGMIEAILVKDLSRLGRNSLQTGYYLERFFPLNEVRFIAVTDNYDSLTDQGDILIPIKNMLNEAHAIDIGKKVQASKHQVRLAGGYTGNLPPYGYKKQVGNCHQLLVDDVSAEVVREIYELVAAGTRVSTVVRMLNERKELSPSDYEKQRQGKKIDKDNPCKWSGFATKKILQSQMYIGNMQQGVHISVNRVVTKNAPENITLVKNTHEPIVSEELFQRVQEQLQNHGFNYTKDKKVVPNLFVGKIICGGCGKKMHRHRYTTKDGYKFSYVCETPYRHGSSFCEYESMFKIREKELLGLLEDILNKQGEILLGKSLLLVEKEIAYETVKAKRDMKLKQQDKLIQKNQKLLKTLYENLVNNIITADDYKNLKFDYEMAVNSAKQEYLEVKEKSDLLLLELNELYVLTEKLNQEGFSFPKEFLAQVVDNITIYSGNKIDIQFSFAFPIIDEVIDYGE